MTCICGHEKSEHTFAGTKPMLDEEDPNQVVLASGMCNHVGPHRCEAGRPPFSKQYMKCGCNEYKER